MSAEQDAEDVEPAPLRVVRDSTFVRFVADQAALSVSGNDVEVGFLQHGPLHGVQSSDDVFETFNSETVLTEVARMRIGLAEMLTIAMNFIRGGIMDGRLKGDAILTTIEGWIAEAAAASDDEK